MAGTPRSYDSATNALSYVIQAQEKRRSEREAFDRRLQQAGIQAGLKSGAIQPQFQNGQLQGFQNSPASSATQTGGFDINNLPPGVQITHTIPGPGGARTVIRMGGQKAAAPPKGLPAAQASQLLGEAEPGTPLPQTRPVYNGQGDMVRQMPNMALGSQGQTTMNQAIAQGMTESPAAQPLGNRIAPHTIPQGPFVAGPGGTGIGGQLDPASTGGGISRQEILGLLAQQPQARPMAQAPQAPQAPVSRMMLPPQSANASAELPNPAGVRDGTVIEDDQSGHRFRLVRGQWVAM